MHDSLSPIPSEAEQLERIPTRLYKTADQACLELAAEISQLIRQRAKENKHAVLGLATGSTPVRLYKELIRLHQEEGLSFANVITYNLDEYYPLAPDHPESYRRFMQEQLFDHIDIPAGQTHVPDGTDERKDVFASCRAYEASIHADGGIDLQILGIGRTGHIGFNEPGSGKDSGTRLVTLDSLTRRDAARDFLGEANVPRHAITMGVGTILAARKVVLLAWGGSKAAVVARAVEGDVTDSLPASFLQLHDNVRFLIDTAAGGELTRSKHPWRVTTVDWSPELTRKAVVWLGLQTKKPILKLVDSQYTEHGMGELIVEHGPVYELNIRTFNVMQHTISGWPGGKPNADDTHRPERAEPHPKRIIVFSPEPIHDVLCMGGTLHRLIDQGHDVHVVYMTSGNLAVPDDEARKATDLVLELGQEQESTTEAAPVSLARTVQEELEAKGLLGADTTAIRRLKGLIRRGEARAASKTCGLSDKRMHFLDLPFYELGRYRQFNPASADVAVVAGLLAEIRPHQLFVTGSLADPTSVEGCCFRVFKEAFAESQASEDAEDCRVWIYRGIGREWSMHEIDMAVPLSPDELSNKVLAVYQHQSQRSQSPLSGDIRREAWQQAEDRNQSTAHLYDVLGLPEYEALEAFRRMR